MNSSSTAPATSSRSSGPKPTGPPKAAAAGDDDQVEQIEQVLAVHKIGRARRGELAQQANDAGLTAGQVGDTLDSTTGGGGLKIARVQDAIDAAHATRERAEARGQADAERVQAEAAEREAEAAGVLTGAERQAAFDRGKKLIRDRVGRLVD